MTENEFTEYYSDRYLTAIQWYDKKSQKNKTIYYIFQMLLIVLSALTPIFAILNMKCIAVIIGIIVSILASLLKFMKLEENWLNYRTICETLKKEQYLYKASISDYNVTENRISLFVERVESLISRENTLWLSTYTMKENQEK